MTEYVYRDGQRLTAWMKYCVDRFSAAFFAMFGLVLFVSSGLRTYQEQVDIFTRRYRIASQVNGRKVYDTRVWNGVRWYRIDPAGTVAVPSTSNHEVQRNYYGAVDLRDSGNDPGISRPNNTRSNWARANAHRFGLEPEGYNFREPWHFRIPDIFRTPPAAPASGGSSKPAVPAAPKRKRKQMSNGVIYTDDKADAQRSGAIVNYEAGTFDPFGWFAPSYADAVAVGFGLERAAKVTRGHYNAIKATIAAKAARDGKVFVDIADEDVPKIAK